METESAAAPPMVHSSAGEGNPHTRTAHTNRLIFSLLYINGYVTAREPRRSYTHVGSSQGDGPTSDDCQTLTSSSRRGRDGLGAIHLYVGAATPASTPCAPSRRPIGSRLMAPCARLCKSEA